MLKGMDPATPLSIVALASNGYKFNGLSVTRGGQRSFRVKQIQLSVDLAARKVQFDVNVKGDWLPAATFRLPARVHRDEYCVLIGAKGCHCGDIGDTSPAQTTTVRLLEMSIH